MSLHSSPPKRFFSIHIARKYCVAHSAKLLFPAGSWMSLHLSNCRTAEGPGMHCQAPSFLRSRLSPFFSPSISFLPSPFPRLVFLFPFLTRDSMLAQCLLTPFQEHATWTLVNKVPEENNTENITFSATFSPLWVASRSCPIEDLRRPLILPA